jgi:hypothetical protein
MESCFGAFDGRRASRRANHNISQEPICLEYV